MLKHIALYTHFKNLSISALKQSLQHSEIVDLGKFAAVIHIEERISLKKVFPMLKG